MFKFGHFRKRLCRDTPQSGAKEKRPSGFAVQKSLQRGLLFLVFSNGASWGAFWSASWGGAFLSIARPLGELF
jgi:hypothetical protein